MSNLITNRTEIETYWANFGLSSAAHKKTLEIYTLQIQDVAIKADIKSIEGTEDAIKKIKKLHGEMVEIRKKATSPLDAVKERLMSFEKQYDPKSWDAFTKLEKANLDLRLKAVELAKAHADKEKEKLEFRMFFEKQYILQKENFFILVGAFVQVAYEEALKADKLPDFAELELKLKDITPPVLASFGSLKHITRDEATEIFKAIPRPEFFINPDLIKEKFATFDIDLKRKVQALQEAKEATEKAAKDATEKANQQALIANLTAHAEVAAPVLPKIKRSVSVETPNSPEDAKLIIATFLTSFSTLSNYIRVTKWENLTIKQMCEAIGKYTTETGDELSKIPYIDVVK